VLHKCTISAAPTLTCDTVAHYYKVINIGTISPEHS